MLICRCLTLHGFGPKKLFSVISEDLKNKTLVEMEDRHIHLEKMCGRFLPETPGSYLVCTLGYHLPHPRFLDGWFPLPIHLPPVDFGSVEHGSLKKTSDILVLETSIMFPLSKVWSPRQIFESRTPTFQIRSSQRRQDELLQMVQDFAAEQVARMEVTRRFLKHLPKPICIS